MSGRDYASMNQMLRTRTDFVDFMSVECRGRCLELYDRRIAALQEARRTLETSTIYRLGKAQTKSAQQLCHDHEWTEEDAALLLEKFAASTPSRANTSTQSVGKIAAGASRLASAMLGP